MRKTTILLALFLSVNVYAAGEVKKQQLSDIKFPGDANFEWGFSKSDVYKGEIKIEPKDLAKKVSQIEKLDNEKTCSKAMELYEKTQKEYAGSPFIYNEIPNCLLSEDVYAAFSTFQLKGSELEKVKKLEPYYSDGARFFNEVFKKSDVSLEELRAALEFRIGFAAFVFLDKSMNAIASIGGTPKFESYYVGILSEEIAQIASDENILLGREILSRDPNNTHAKALLGTILVGNSWTKIVNAFMAETFKKKDLDVVAFIENRGKAMNFDEAKTLLEPICAANNYQACQDLAAAYMLTGSYDKARDLFYKAFELNSLNRKPIGGILFTMVLEKLDDFKSDKAKEVASRFADVMVKKLGKTSEPYDYLITAKILYRLDRNAEALKCINDGLKAFSNDSMLNLGKAFVFAKDDNFSDAKKILDEVTAKLDDTNKKEAEKLRMYIAGR